MAKKKAVKKESNGSDYNSDWYNSYNMQRRRDSANIGDPPEVVDPERKEACRNDLRLFCETYRPQAFSKGFSDDHLSVIKLAEKTITESGLFAVAMPRGNGKTTITITTAMWALLYGHRKWVCLIGATAPKALSLLKGIKTELRFNPQLFQDFPEVCFPITKLEGRATRAAAQHINNVETSIGWTTDNIILPTVRGSESSGSTVSVAGITGDIRGQQRTTQEGSIIRPDFVIIDDPQTRESANSPTQVDDRVSIIYGDILGLAGPGVKIAGIMPFTVVAKNDMADQILEGERGHEWKPFRSKLLYGEPKSVDLWDKYREIREEELIDGSSFEGSLSFYRKNQEEMDDGLEAAWEHRKSDDDVSAIQHAMDLKFRDPVAFQSEYQNEPPDIDMGDLLTEEELSQRTNNLDRYIALDDSRTVVAMIDVQKECLYYVVCAFGDGFTGNVLDYGTFPDNGYPNYKYNNLRKKFSKTWPGKKLDYHLRRGLDTTVGLLKEKKYTTPDGVQLKLDKVIVDANWGISRNIIYDWVRRSEHRNLVLPSHGRGITASSAALNERVKMKRKWMGDNWRIEVGKDIKVNYLLYDTNYWKTFTHNRFATYPGEAGSLTLFDEREGYHNSFASHCLAEFPVRVESKERSQDEWKIKANRPDNHWFDCVVGCCVAASVQRINLNDPVEIHLKPRTSAPRVKVVEAEAL